MQTVLVLLLAACGVALDQLVKAWCVTDLAPLHTIPLIPDVFHLTYAENHGAGFSILSGQRWLLIAVTGAVLIGMLFLLLTKRIPKGMLSWAIGLVISGAVGNLIDRVRQGFVVDLFDFRLINFAIFNVADVLICTGAGLLILWTILETVRENKENKQKPTCTENNNDGNHHSDT